MGLLKFAAVVLLYAVITQGEPAPAAEESKPVDPAVTCAWSEWEEKRGCRKNRAGNLVETWGRHCVEVKEDGTEVVPATDEKPAKPGKPGRRPRGKCFGGCKKLEGKRFEQRACTEEVTCALSEWSEWKECRKNRAGNLVETKLRKCVEVKDGTEVVPARNCFGGCKKIEGKRFEHRACTEATGGKQGNGNGNHGGKRGGRPRGGKKGRGRNGPRGMKNKGKGGRGKMNKGKGGNNAGK